MPPPAAPRLPLIIATGKTRVTQRQSAARAVAERSQHGLSADIAPHPFTAAPRHLAGDPLLALAYLAGDSRVIARRHMISSAALVFTASRVVGGPPTGHHGFDSRPHGAEFLLIEVAATLMLVNPLLARSASVSVAVEAGLGAAATMLARELLGAQVSVTLKPPVHTSNAATPTNDHTPAMVIRFEDGHISTVWHGSRHDNQQPIPNDIAEERITADSDQAPPTPLRTITSRRRVTRDTETIEIALGGDHPLALFESWTVDIDHHPGAFVPTWRCSRVNALHGDGDLPLAIALNAFAKEGARTVCIRATDVCGHDYEEIVTLSGRPS